MFDKSRLCISAGLKDPAVGQTDLFCVFPTVATPEISIGGSCYGENIARSLVNILSVIVKIIEYLIIGHVEMCQRCAYAYRKKARETQNKSGQQMVWVRVTRAWGARPRERAPPTCRPDVRMTWSDITYSQVGRPFCAIMERSKRAASGGPEDGTGQADEPHAGRVGGKGQAHEAGRAPRPDGPRGALGRGCWPWSSP